MLDYTDIVQAYEKITKYKNPTFLQYSGTLSSMTNSQVFFKPENLQLTGSFKLGGAMNVMMNLIKKEKNRGVVTCSAGNWAQAVAYAARLFNIRSVIVMAEQASPIKIDATKGYGAEVVIFGKNSNDVATKAREIAQQEGLTFLSPFEDEDLIAGHGTIGLEILKEKPDAETIFCPVGGGAFISGIALAIKEKNPKVKIIGVEPLNANAMWLSLQENRIVEKEHVDTIADGLALKKPGEKPFQIVQKYVDDIVLVNEDEIKKAVVFLLERAKLLVEPSGAVSVAAIMADKFSIKNKKTVAILSGGNLDLDKLVSLISNGK
ncbi:MAG: threonine/serine dehydratase [Atribacterota bacterium]|nr:threonine/serine dehydratase [Atribacterota bacterium]MDD4895619.1 threonine/serine dehydratase [Atribacterota bacterium]MDD5636714.1 threonine/serine dehydratase [Atribacterota bacterium]